MIIRVDHNKEKPYVQISKSLLEDDKLSWGAKGLLSYLLSRPDNWKVSAQHLSKIYTGSSKGNGIKAIRGIIKELIELGYCEFHQPKSPEGKFESGEYVIREFKKCLPRSLERHTVQGYAVKDTLIKKEDNKEGIEQEPPIVPQPQKLANASGKTANAVSEGFNDSSKDSKLKKKVKPKINDKPLVGVVVRLTPQEHDKLKDDHGSGLIERLIDEMDDYCLSTGKKYQDYAAALRQWIRKRKDTQQKDRKFAPSSDDSKAFEKLKKMKERGL